jgi:hypothetical protein
VNSDKAASSREGGSREEVAIHGRSDRRSPDGECNGTADSRRTADDLGVLARPFEAFSIPHDFEDIFDIVHWWWFNPFGSTMCALRLFDFMPLKSRLVTVA